MGCFISFECNVCFFRILEHRLSMFACGWSCFWFIDLFSTIFWTLNMPWSILFHFGYKFRKWFVRFEKSTCLVVNRTLIFPQSMWIFVIISDWEIFYLISKIFPSVVLRLILILSFVNWLRPKEQSFHFVEFCFVLLMRLLDEIDCPLPSIRMHVIYLLGNLIKIYIDHQIHIE